MMRLIPLWAWGIGGVAIVAVLGTLYTSQLGRAYDRGVAAERAEQLKAIHEAQRLHDAAIAEKQSEIDRITQAAEQLRFQSAARYSALQQKLAEIRDEEFGCPPDRPVFPEQLRRELDAVGRDQHQAAPH